MVLMNLFAWQEWRHMYKCMNAKGGGKEDVG